MKRLMPALLLVVALVGCSREDRQEIKREADQASKEIKKRADDASTELKKEVDQIKQGLKSKSAKHTTQ